MSSTRTSLPTRGQLLAGFSAVLVATALGFAAAALTGGAASAAAPAPRPAADHIARFVAVDVVAPTPVQVTLVAPQQVTPQPTAPRLPAVHRAATVTPAAVAPAAPVCGTPQERASAALASLLHPIPAGVTYTFSAGGGALKGMTDYGTHHVDVYVASCASESDALLRHVVAHETGHAWDSLHMTDALRADYLAARGIPAGTPWFGCNHCQDFATPAGDFAETYAQWQRGASDSRSTIAAPATPAQLADLGARFFS